MQNDCKTVFGNVFLSHWFSFNILNHTGKPILLSFQVCWPGNLIGFRFRHGNGCYYFFLSTPCTKAERRQFQIVVLSETAGSLLSCKCMPIKSPWDKQTSRLYNTNQLSWTPDKIEVCSRGMLMWFQCLIICMEGLADSSTSRVLSCILI